MLLAHFTLLNFRPKINAEEIGLELRGCGVGFHQILPFAHLKKKKWIG